MPEEYIVANDPNRRKARRLVALCGAVLTIIALLAPVESARAELVTLLRTSNWDAAVEARQFIGVIGRTQAGSPMPARVREFAFYLSVKTRRFGLLIETRRLVCPAAPGCPSSSCFLACKLSASKPRC